VAESAGVAALADAVYRSFEAAHRLCNNSGFSAAALHTPAWETRRWT
jgi:hypothetical protein